MITLADKVGEREFFAVAGMFVGLIGGLVIATVSGSTGLSANQVQMISPDQFCQEHDYQQGYYTSGHGAPTIDNLLETAAGIRCFNDTGSHEKGTWRTTASAEFFIDRNYRIVNKTVRDKANESAEKMLGDKSLMEHGQLNVDTIGNTLTVSLPNYPIPDSTYMDGASMVTEYRHPDGETRNEPPIEKERDGDKEIIRRKDNGSICGMIIHNWDKHEDASLMNFESQEDSYIVLDPPRR